jgi:hypothetical protein
MSPTIRPYKPLTRSTVQPVFPKGLITALEDHALAALQAHRHEIAPKVYSLIDNTITLLIVEATIAAGRTTPTTNHCLIETVSSLAWDLAALGIPFHGPHGISV